MSSVQCGHCGGVLGDVEDFGFLSLDERTGLKSHHLVLRHEKVEEFVSNHVNVDPLLEKGKYYVVYCKDCSQDVGKKMIDRGIEYIAFGKEKVSVDGKILKKSDKWAMEMDACPEYAVLKRLQIGDFRGASNRDRRTGSGSCMDGRGRGGRGGGRSDGRSSTPRDQQQGGGRGNSSYNSSRGPPYNPSPSQQAASARYGGAPPTAPSSRSFPPAAAAAGGGGGSGREWRAEREQPERRVIGTTVKDKLDFLRAKKENWEASKIVHELTGPNKKNWESIILEGVPADSSNELLREVFSLLSHNEIRDSPQAASLYIPLGEAMALAGMQRYILVGPLGGMAVKSAVDKGYGSPAWNSALKDAVAAVQTIVSLMQRSVGCQKNPLLPVELLKTPIEALVGLSVSSLESDDAEQDPSQTLASSPKWLPYLSKEEKNQGVASALHLLHEYASVQRIRNAAMEAIEDETRIREEEAKAQEQEQRLTHQRLRAGVEFLDDPTCDKDYLSLSAVPEARELISDAPTALPKNIVLSLGRGGRYQEEADEDAYAAPIPSEGSAAAAAAAGGGSGTVVPASQPRYRSIHHYLNTHFQLNREDCLAQLRRGISSFREKIGASSARDQQGTKSDPRNNNREGRRGDAGNDGDSTRDIDPPSQQKLHQVAVSMAHQRAGNSSVYIYENVTVQGIARSYDDVGYLIAFSVVGSSNRIKWSNTQRFMKGSLLCLSPDGTFNESTLVVATVLRGVVEGGWQPLVTIGIDKGSVGRFDPAATYLMIESMVFFEAYRPVLAALQKIGREGEIPFSSNLLGKSRAVQRPSYLTEASVMPLGQGAGSLRPRPPGSFLSSSSFDTTPHKKAWDMSAVFPDFEAVNGTKYWNCVKTPKLPPLPNDPSLDGSQKEAIRLALSNNLCLIQGPPGTGKTFVGVLISKLLISNRSLRSPKPVLFICQTNHALDQMLEKVYEFDEHIVRLGGRSESAIMQSLNIAQMRKDSSRVTRNRRSTTELAALDMMRFSMLAMQASLTQRRTLRDAAAAVAANQTSSFSNSVLARLARIVDELDGLGLVDDLVDKSPANLQQSAWKECYDEARKRFHVKPGDDPQFLDSDSAWLDGDVNVALQEWMYLSVNRQMRLMATYVPEGSTIAPGATLVDNWVRGDAKKKRSKKKAAVSADGWQTVGGGGAAAAGGGVSDDEDEAEDDKCVLALNAAVSSMKTPSSSGNDVNNVDDDDDSLEELLDPADLQAIRNREIDDFDDGSYMFALQGMTTRYRSDEELALSLIDRSVSRDTFSDLSHADRQFLGRVAQIGSVWDLSRAMRQRLLVLWAQLLERDAAADVAKFTRDYRSAALVEAKYLARCDADILRGAAAIGMTTNGAAKYNEIIRSLNPEVVVVEEAAEVSEASVIASFTQATKHVILIGDHQQLRPQVSEYSLAVHNGLEVSLFERLIRLGVPYVTLTTQRRMHPEISSLITPSIYRHLDDAPCVSEYPMVRGVTQRMFFITHSVPEDGEKALVAGGIGASSGGGPVVRGNAIADAVAERSKTNTFEAEFLIGLLKYLVREASFALS